MSDPTASELFMTGVVGDANLSPCGKYRYRLTRVWGEGLPLVYWIMLNPSTADASHDDPTIRRCMGFAESWGCGGIDVRNLFALRATDPIALRHAADPVGPENNAHLAALPKDSLVVAAWGTGGNLFQRDQRVLDMLQVTHGIKLFCLGVTKDGHPKHPLYVRGDTGPVPFPVHHN